MSSAQIWDIIITDLRKNKKEFETKEGLYIAAEYKGNSIVINRATENEPSSQITSERKISKNEFYKAYEADIEIEAGRAKRSDFNLQNLSYCFSLIKCYK